jgi:hypothetical protein
MLKGWLVPMRDYTFPSSVMLKSSHASKAIVNHRNLHFSDRLLPSMDGGVPPNLYLL